MYIGGNKFFARQSIFFTEYSPNVKHYFRYFILIIIIKKLEIYYKTFRKTLQINLHNIFIYYNKALIKVIEICLLK